jgi:hypothetical protein
MVATALALQLIALVLAHDLTFLARFGSRYGEELAHAGHEQTWAAAVESSVVLAVVLGALAISRLLQLRRRLWSQAISESAPGGPRPGGPRPRRHEHSGPERPGHERRGHERRGPAQHALLRGFFRTWLQSATRIGLLGVVLLTIQENIERAAIGQAAPGPGILLSPEYPFGLWIALAVGAVVAFVAALFEHRQQVLLARLRAARQVHRRTHAAPAAWPRVDVLSGHEFLLGRRSGLRAPPAPTPV